MLRNIKNILRNIAVTIVAAMFFYACNQNPKAYYDKSFEEIPLGVGKEVVIKHTDSGRLTAVLKTPEMLDFTQHKDFPYYEFPKGIELEVYDKKGGKSIVTSDYAINYVSNKLVDLQGNVHIVTSDSTVLDAPQLFWNQRLHWVYTDQEYTVHFKNGGVNNGLGFDANEDFTSFKSRNNSGLQVIED